MKKALPILLFVFLVFPLASQDIVGNWDGVLKVQNIELHLVFHISKTEMGYTSIMDSPDQGAYGIRVSNTVYESPKLILEVEKLGIKYEGSVESENKIVGNFTQMGQEFPLTLTKNNQKEIALIRPQEPKPPFAYYSEEITFKNKVDGFNLAGTLTLPNKNGVFPAVVLISGSGAQDRNEEIFGHKPFFVLADYLTKNGIAVLRFDDRGTGASKGNFNNATTHDFAKDVESAVDYLMQRKEVNIHKIGLIGHSEGGIIAPMVANKMNEVSFIVLLAGTGIPGDELLLLQQRLISQTYGISDDKLDKMYTINKGAYQLVKNIDDEVELKTALSEYFTKTTSENHGDLAEVNKAKLVQASVNHLNTPWMRYFIRYNPAPELAKVTCPVLALNGAKDLQVPPNENISAIKAALVSGGNSNVTTIEYPNLNHMFQHCETGSPIEYGKIEETMAPEVLAEVKSWILKQIN